MGGSRFGDHVTTTRDVPAIVSTPPAFKQPTLAAMSEVGSVVDGDSGNVGGGGGDDVSNEVPFRMISAASVTSPPPSVIGEDDGPARSMAGSRLHRQALQQQRQQSRAPSIAHQYQQQQPRFMPSYESVRSVTDQSTVIMARSPLASSMPLNFGAHAGPPPPFAVPAASSADAVTVEGEVMGLGLGLRPPSPFEREEVIQTPYTAPRQVSGTVGIGVSASAGRDVGVYQRIVAPEVTYQPPSAQQMSETTKTTTIAKGGIDGNEKEVRMKTGTTGARKVPLPPSVPGSTSNVPRSLAEVSGTPKVAGPTAETPPQGLLQNHLQPHPRPSNSPSKSTKSGKSGHSGPRSSPVASPRPDGSPPTRSPAQQSGKSSSKSARSVKVLHQLQASGLGHEMASTSAEPLSTESSADISRLEDQPEIAPPVDAPSPRIEIPKKVTQLTEGAVTVAVLPNASEEEAKIRARIPSNAPTPSISRTPSYAQVQKAAQAQGSVPSRRQSVSKPPPPSASLHTRPGVEPVVQSQPQTAQVENASRPSRVASQPPSQTPPSTSRTSPQPPSQSSSQPRPQVTSPEPSVAPSTPRIGSSHTVASVQSPWKKFVLPSSMAASNLGPGVKIPAPSNPPQRFNTPPDARMNSQDALVSNKTTDAIRVETTGNHLRSGKESVEMPPPVQTQPFASTNSQPQVRGHPIPAPINTNVNGSAPKQAPAPAPAAASSTQPQPQPQPQAKSHHVPPTSQPPQIQTQRPYDAHAWENDLVTPISSLNDLEGPSTSFKFGYAGVGAGRSGYVPSSSSVDFDMSGGNGNGEGLGQVIANALKNTGIGTPARIGPATGASTVPSTNVSGTVTPTAITALNQPFSQPNPSSSNTSTIPAQPANVNPSLSNPPAVRPSVPFDSDHNANLTGIGLGSGFGLGWGGASDPVELTLKREREVLAQMQQAQLARENAKKPVNEAAPNAANGMKVKESGSSSIDQRRTMHQHEEGRENAHKPAVSAVPAEPKTSPVKPRAPQQQAQNTLGGGGGSIGKASAAKIQTATHVPDDVFVVPSASKGKSTSNPAPTPTLGGPSVKPVTNPQASTKRESVGAGDPIASSGGAVGTVKSDSARIENVKKVEPQDGSASKQSKPVATNNKPQDPPRGTQTQTANLPKPSAPVIVGPPIPVLRPNVSYRSSTINHSLLEC